MSLRDYDGHRPRFRFPRVSGDEPARRSPVAIDSLFSPRERG